MGSYSSTRGRSNGCRYVVAGRPQSAARLVLGEFAGHSLRAGFVTSAADRGAKTDRIMDVTGYRSHAMVCTYTRRADTLSDHAGAGLV